MSLTSRAHIRIALAQTNPTLGDIASNAALLQRVRAAAAAAKADVVMFPELFITGYPPEDLSRRPSFAAASRAMVETLAKDTDDGGPAVLVGCVWPEDGRYYNALALLDQGKVAGIRFKVDLPNYGTFDEKRVFDVGPMPGPLMVRGVRIGVPICEDIWHDAVVECLEETGAEILLVPNGSPFSLGKHDVRMQIAVARVTESGLPLAYLNQLGGQDELVFDGASFVLNADRTLAVQAPAWTEALVITDWQRTEKGWHCTPGERALVEEGDASAYRACVLGLRDYVRKNGFPGVVLGMSGGVDSALVAAMAVDALGAEHVHCLMLPFRYTSDDSFADAKDCANRLGARYDVVPILAPVDGFTEALGPLFTGRAADVTEENLQSRVRGTLLMAVSNKFGAMVVTTGNKSEVSVGYCTLYGDMNGGFNPIKDLYKMQVYALCRWRNANRPDGLLGPAGVVIPERIITKAPTAELRPNQKDQDSLPPYDVLDDILMGLVEKELSVADLIASGHAPQTVKKVERLLYLAEYKRRQAAPGVKISERNFGRDRRYPITNRYRES
jgi:NAD+ synthase